MILSCNNIFTLLFYHIFNQINSPLVSIRDFIKMIAFEWYCLLARHQNDKENLSGQYCTTSLLYSVSSEIIKEFYVTELFAIFH